LAIEASIPFGSKQIIFEFHHYSKCYYQCFLLVKFQNLATIKRPLQISLKEFEAICQDATIWQQAIATHLINSLGLVLPGLTTLHCWMPQPSPLWAPFRISPHLELTNICKQL
jgi:hypothetical protein